MKDNTGFKYVVQLVMHKVCNRLSPKYPNIGKVFMHLPKYLHSNQVIGLTFQ